jgi:single-strand DNA-binding protein
MYNKVFLIGNLTRDPEVRYTPAGIPTARFALAVNRIQKKGAETEGKQTVDFINIIAWRRTAEICGEYLKKGSPVAIEGRLQIRKYEKNGEKMEYAEVVVDNMQMLPRRQGGAGQTEEASGEAARKMGASLETEIPF